jgi:formate hydrogenlyase transcriptional activator
MQGGVDGGLISIEKNHVNLGLDQRYRIVMEINQVLSSHDRVSFFSSIANILGKVLQYDRAQLAILDPHKKVFRMFDLADAEQVRDGGPEFSAQDSVHLMVMESRQPLIYSDSDSSFQSGILVPLRKNGTVLGTLNIVSRQSNQYSEADCELLLEIGRQIALPIENMLALEEIARLRSRLEYEHLYLQEEIQVERQFKNIVGQSLAIRRVLKAVETVSPTDAGVLLFGETGTGKELIVRAIHELSSRCGKPLINVNCAALPAGLIESELFGHEKGAFTGAFSRKLGRFEMADGGTIFLDEVGDLQLDLQAKLLRVLQEGELERVGGHQTLKVDVRVIAATNRDLEQSIHEGKFRADLYYRLNVFPIRIPPLRERKEDIPLLVKYFVMKYGAKFRKNVEKITQGTMDSLLAYQWPGNIRELENLIERAVIMCKTAQLEPGKWLPEPGGAPLESRIPTLEELERDHIIEVLQMTGWKVSGDRGAAKLLGMKPTTLEARMKKLGIKRT